MSRFFAATRYLIIIPIIGLGLAAAAFFLFGGYGFSKDYPVEKLYRDAR